MNGYDEFFDLMQQEDEYWREEERERRFERWCDYIDEQEEKGWVEESPPWEEAVWGK